MIVNMKKVLRYCFFCLVVVPMACTGNYLDINSNPYEPGKEDMSTDGYDVGSAMSAIAGTVVSTDVNTAQFTDCLLGGPLGRYYSSSIGSETTVDNNNATDDWTRVFMASDELIPKLYSNFRELQMLTDDPVILSVADVIKVAAMSRVTDTYGPIPYSMIGIGGQLKVKYDSQKEVYEKFFEELTAAVKVFTENRAGFSPKADPVYGGSSEKWCKFANSLKLRLAMRIVYAEPELARKMAEEAVNHEIGVFTSNADNARLIAKQFGEKGNPLYTAIKYNQVAGTNTGGDTHVAADITTYMNGYQDPRRSKYFVPSLFEDEQYKYVGMRVGIVRPPLKPNGCKYSGVNISPLDDIIWMNASEVAFLKAEAQAIFGFEMGGFAGDFYNEGIRLSFQHWGVNGADAYLADTTLKPGTYTDPLSQNNYSKVLSEVTIKWEEDAPVEEKQERIIIQKWIANFNLGNEAWADYRRTGFPCFIPASKEGNKSQVVDNELGPRRMKYPLIESTNNSENYIEAVNTYFKGHDDMAQRIWWDCNPRIWNE